jgi:hypothetical protein
MTLISQRDDPSPCPDCGSPGERSKLYVTQIDRAAASDWNNISFNPGLGQWTKSNKHAQQIAKAKGMIEVGNEKPENIHKHFDKQREDTAAQRWTDADRDKVYD